MKNIAVILSGCGVYDGAEIHESVFTMLAIDKNGAQYELFAPNIFQHHVINHTNGEEMYETRNVMVEAARIARGSINDLIELDVNKFDAIIFLGGFGVAKNLCDYAFNGASCQVNQEVADIIKKAKEVNKVIGAMCISPVLISKVLDNIEVTIGSDEATAKDIESFNAVHKSAKVSEVVIDSENKIVTTPCYMLDASISEIAEGAEALVKEVLKLA